MRIASIVIGVFFVLAAAHADDYLAKDGKLTQGLKITQLQGGFAGFTGTETVIEPDGTWSTASVFKKKLTPKDKGKLSANELESLAKLLEKNEVEKLPEKSGKQPGANPFMLTIEFGKTKAVFVGQSAPKSDANEPMSVESRFAAIHRAVIALTKPKQ